MAESIFRRVFFSIYSYCIIYALFGVLSLSYHACFNSSLSTLEKRYRFSSSTSGYIMITDNIATVLTNLFIGHYGKTAHKPRWMSIGCVVSGLSVMVTALPYFIYGPASEPDLELAGNLTISTSSQNSTDQVCHPATRDCAQLVSSTMTTVAITCFAVSNFFRGFGTSIYLTYGTPYLDDNVSKAKMPTFFAFIFAARIMGAPFGFYMSSTALKFYEDPFSPPPNLVDTDPRWIGAWWIGFLASGILMILLAIPLSLFPREFKKKKPSTTIDSIGLINNNKALVERADATQPHPIDYLEPDPPQNDATKKKSASKKDLSLAELPGEVWAILSNPLIICQMVGNLFRGIGIIGYFVFQTKYLESQFRQSASKASLISGTTGFLAKIFGVLFGGILISAFRPKARVLTTYIFLVELTSIFTLLYGATVMGPQYSYPHTSIKLNGQLELNNQCNKPCSCDNVEYQPACEYSAMKAYFSPCHAGCNHSFKTVDGGTTFTQCECIDEPSKTLNQCPPDTDRLMKYATIVALGGMISGSSRSGNMVTFFRSINPDQKSLAVAVSSFWHSLFVSIPYPIIYGKIFDFCCLVWKRECNKRGNCWLYDTEKLRYIYHGFSIVLIAIGSFFDLIMIFLSPRLGDLYDKDESESKRSFWSRFKLSKRKKKSPAVKDDDAKQSNGLVMTSL